jgi:hypothetical protein
VTALSRDELLEECQAQALAIHNDLRTDSTGEDVADLETMVCDLAAVVADLARLMRKDEPTRPSIPPTRPSSPAVAAAIKASDSAKLHAAERAETIARRSQR